MPVESTDKHIRVRVKMPSDFVSDSMRTITLSEEEGIYSVVGKLKSEPNGSMVNQNFMFLVGKGWTEEKATKWAKDHGHEPKNMDIIDRKDAVMDYKIFPADVKVKRVGCEMYLEGYANTKGMADRYGDIPTVFKGVRDFVYDLSEYMKNPVLLIDHQNSVDHVVGSMEHIKEDERGLFFRAKFSKSEHPNVKHAREVYGEGHAKGISIAGRFLHENPENPDHLTLAKIYEISLVPVGADSNALAEAVAKTLKDFKEPAVNEASAGKIFHNIVTEKEELAKIFIVLQRLDGGVTLSADELRLMRTWSDDLREKLFGTKKFFDPAEAIRKLEAMERSENN